VSAELIPRPRQEDRRVGDRLELLTALINGPAFDPIFRPDLIRIPNYHPVFPWNCRVLDCGRSRENGRDLCHAHLGQWQRDARPAGVDRAEFLRTAAPLIALAASPEPCLVCKHRPAMRRLPRLCSGHYSRWERVSRRSGSAFEDWLATQSPLVPYGTCRVVSCPELARSPRGLCGDHEHTYAKDGRPGGMALPKGWFNLRRGDGQARVAVHYDDEAAFRRWCRTVPPKYRPGQINLLGLHPLIKDEIRYGLFAHTQRRQHTQWDLLYLHWLVLACRGLGSLSDLDRDGCRHPVRIVAAEMITSLRAIYFTPSDTREAGYIETAHFGVELKSRSGRIDLTRVTQRWLRDLLWEYMAGQLRSSHGPRTGGPYDCLRRAAVELSAFLEAGAPEGGHRPALLGDEHMHSFVADQRHRANNALPSLGIHRRDGAPSTVTDQTRSTVFTYTRRLLRYALESGEADRLGLDRAFIVAAPPGGNAAGRTRSPFTDEIALALADETNLRRLADTYDPRDRGLRDIWETIIATGRRCNEVIKLRLDCVGRYGGVPLLWHDQTKVGNYDEAIRIPEYIYQRLTERQRTTMARFEERHGRQPTEQERARMALFPSHIRNVNSLRSLSYHWFHGSFRSWIGELDLGACVPHQARHTLATKLLAHGAGLHHIKRYLGQVSLRMAEHYAKVATSEIDDVLQHVWVAGPGAARPGELLSAGITPMSKQQAQALAVDLSRRSTPTEGGFCTFQPVVDGGACPWNLNCTSCDNFVISGADLLYWRRKREQWASIAERAPNDATADYLHKVFEPTAAAIDGLEKALAGLGLLDEALALDLRRPQDYFNRMWSLSFRAADLAGHSGAEEYA
jgi:integrase